MEKKTEKQNDVKDVKGILVKKENLTTLSESPEALKKEIEELRAKLKEPANIDERIEYYRQKQSLIKKRDLLITQYEKFKEHNEKLQTVAESDEFTTEDYNLSLNNKNNYRDEPIVLVKNPVILSELLEYVMAKMTVKIASLDEKIAC